MTASLGQPSGGPRRAAAHVGDQVVKRLAGADLDPHLEKLIELLFGAAFNFHCHASLAVRLPKQNPPRRSNRLEYKPIWRSNLAIDAGEGHIGMALGHELERAAWPQVDLADCEPPARSVPPAGQMLRHCPGFEYFRARRIEVAREPYGVRRAIDAEVGFGSGLRCRRHVISPVVSYWRDRPRDYRGG